MFGEQFMEVRSLQETDQAAHGERCLPKTQDVEIYLTYTLGGYIYTGCAKNLLHFENNILYKFCFIHKTWNNTIWNNLLTSCVLCIRFMENCSFKMLQVQQVRSIKITTNQCSRTSFFHSRQQTVINHTCYAYGATLSPPRDFNFVKSNMHARQDQYTSANLPTPWNGVMENDYFIIIKMVLQLTPQHVCCGTNFRTVSTKKKATLVAAKFRGSRFVLLSFLYEIDYWYFMAVEWKHLQNFLYFSTQSPSIEKQSFQRFSKRSIPFDTSTLYLQNILKLWAIQNKSVTCSFFF